MLLIPGTLDFAYTVGLWHTFRLPELAMFGLDGEGMQQGSPLRAVRKSRRRRPCRCVRIVG